MGITKKFAGNVGVFLVLSAYSLFPSSLAAGRGELSVAVGNGLGALRYYGTPKNRPGAGLWVLEPPSWQPEVLPGFKLRYPNGTTVSLNEVRAEMLANVTRHGLTPELVFERELRKQGFKSFEEAMEVMHRDSFTGRWQKNWKDLYRTAPPILVKEMDRTVNLTVLAGPFDRIQNFDSVWRNRMTPMQQQLATGGMGAAELALVLCSDVNFARRFNEISGIETVGLGISGSEILLTHGNSSITAFFEKKGIGNASNSIVVLFNDAGVNTNEALVIHKQIIIGKVRSYKREPLGLEAMLDLIRTPLKFGIGTEIAQPQPTFGYPVP